MKITVTADDILHGEPKMCTACPVALALKRATGKVWHVDGEGMHEVFGPFNVRPTPPEVARWIGLFDTTGEVEPFEFEINLEARP